MYIFGGAIDIARPANWPEGVDFPVQARIVSAVFDSAQFERNRSGMNWNILIQVDETDMRNQTRCIDIFNRYSSPTDVYGLAKYYILRADGNLYERFDWRPSAQGSYTPDPARDIQIVLARSVEKAAFEDNLIGDRILLDTIEGVPTVDPLTLNLYIRQQAAMIRRLLNLKSRELRPDA